MISKIECSQSQRVCRMESQRKILESLVLIFLGSKVTADGDCSHEIKRCLLLRRKVMTNFSSVQSLSRVRLFVTPWIAGRQVPLSIINSRVHSYSHPSSQWCHPDISSSVIPFSSCIPSFLASGSFPMSCSLYQVPKVLEFQLQHQSFQRTPRADLL